MFLKKIGICFFPDILTTFSTSNSDYTFLDNNEVFTSTDFSLNGIDLSNIVNHITFYINNIMSSNQQKVDNKILFISDNSYLSTL